MRILLIDDNEMSAQFLKALLTPRRPGAIPFQVWRVPTLFDALRCLDGAGPVDAILLDLGLPECAGLTTLKLVRAHVPAIPVVVVSANDQPETIREAKLLGARDYLIKGQFGGPRLEQALHDAVATRLESDEPADRPKLGGSFLRAQGPHAG